MMTYLIGSRKLLVSQETQVITRSYSYRVILFLNVHFICYLIRWPWHPPKAGICHFSVGKQKQSRTNDFSVTVQWSSSLRPCTLSPTKHPDFFKPGNKSDLKVSFSLIGSGAPEVFLHHTRSSMSPDTKDLIMRKHWTLVWLVCWQHPATYQKITQDNPSDREHCWRQMGPSGCDVSRRGQMAPTCFWTISSRIDFCLSPK